MAPIVTRPRRWRPGAIRLIVETVDEMVEHRPHPFLRGVVESAHGYRITGASSGVHLGMPSSSLTVIIPLDVPLMLAQGRPDALPFDTVLAGMHRTAARIHHDGNQFGIQLALSPPGARALFGLPAGELADVSVPIDEVLPDSSVAIDRMRHATSWAHRFAVLDTLLLEQVAANVRPIDEMLLRAWNLSRSDARCHISDIAGSLGWSTRNLQKRFHAEFGISPAEPARLHRFHRSVRLVRDPSLPLAHAAALAGYSDQSHMTRAWVQRTGVAPARWRATETLLTAQPAT